jgi:hypothetical protein
MTRQIEGETRQPAEPWDKADLLFLANAVAPGMPFCEVAGFLCRTEEDVRARDWVQRACPPARRSRERKGCVEAGD